VRKKNPIGYPGQLNAIIPRAAAAAAAAAHSW